MVSSFCLLVLSASVASGVSQLEGSSLFQKSSAVSRSITKSETVTTLQNRRRRRTVMHAKEVALNEVIQAAWPVHKSKEKCKIPGEAVDSQAECEEKAIEKGDAYYQYLEKTSGNLCATFTSCSQFKETNWDWKIFKNPDEAEGEEAEEEEEKQKEKEETGQEKIEQPQLRGMNPKQTNTQAKQTSIETRKQTNK
eukprot:gnl/MRDRNA2_/MRDRNA2_31283_c0_seq1.p1 gnl/MRDRNA2_/MRDRNA2_31283_c0~~gnl/MRDRNA2_/MRDRNA2_31283_c0_seq1.p1  ORF type:complete len:195 (+),score=48.04 gnl/MRDRNA2_/MRDRNA2_31283_c0_seq1:115-699(+)